MPDDAPEPPAAPLPAEGLSEANARSARIAQLEQRLARPPNVGVMPPVAALALVAAVLLLVLQRHNAAYFFSSKEPLTLGAEGAYALDRLISNRYVQVRGVPTLRAAYGSQRGVTVVAVGLQQTPLMVWRPTLPTEAWDGKGTPPRPDQRPFQVRGRLISRAEAGGTYAEAFAQLESFGEVSPQWVIVESARPGGDLGGMALVTALLAFAGINGWLLARGVLARLRARRAP
jgi:hypothetical protein